jgi:trimethylamine:corrinoid methyltransferase-like protein
MDNEKIVPEETPLGYVRFDYQGPPKSRKQIEAIELGTMQVLDRLGVPAAGKPNEALQQKTISGGVIEIQLRIPAALLEPAVDSITRALQEVEQRHYGSRVRKCLQNLFRQWRQKAPKKDE